MKRVLKWVLSKRDTTIRFGGSIDFLSVGYQGGNICVWGLAEDASGPGEWSVRLVVCGTGEELPSGIYSRRFVGRATETIGDSLYEWHVFEVNTNADMSLIGGDVAAGVK